MMPPHEDALPHTGGAHGCPFCDSDNIEAFPVFAGEETGFSRLLSQRFGSPMGLVLHCNQCSKDWIEDDAYNVLRTVKEGTKEWNLLHDRVLPLRLEENKYWSWRWLSIPLGLIGIVLLFLGAQNVVQYSGPGGSGVVFQEGPLYGAGGVVLLLSSILVFIGFHYLASSKHRQASKLLDNYKDEFQQHEASFNDMQTLT